MHILKSILLTDTASHYICGRDLNGGAEFGFELRELNPKFLGDVPLHWRPGDIMTVRLDDSTHEVEPRIVTPQHHILRLCEFHIYDITHAPLTEAGDEKQGRHIFLQGRATSGPVFILPMLGYNAWGAAWNFGSLAARLQQAETLQPSGLSHELTVQQVVSADELEIHAEFYNDIFYPGTQQAGTVFNQAGQFTVTCFTTRQTGQDRAAMLVAAFVKRNKAGLVGYKDYPQVKRGTAFSTPYFVVDGEPAFIRTGPEPLH